MYIYHDEHILIIGNFSQIVKVYIRDQGIYTTHLSDKWVKAEKNDSI